MVKEDALLKYIRNCHYNNKKTNADEMDFLIKQGASINYLDTYSIGDYDSTQDTPLIFACKIGDVTTVKLLLKNDVDVNIVITACKYYDYSSAKEGQLISSSVKSETAFDRTTQNYKEIMNNNTNTWSYTQELRENYKKIFGLMEEAMGGLDKQLSKIEWDEVHVI